ncbi:MAG: hypothetical protein KDD73_04800 [Anaerolineales bacterium]|nr:hypothetical protein [Anaerolineales bacterium]MCB9128327.1 hypothetical protein [Ardenticatenales bacterium]MCB9172139.1 hypothetical protein [Ardenticatenales bacterium]
MDRVEKIVRRVRVDEQGTDFAYWQMQPPIRRLATVEQIRREYHQWKYGSEPRLQRVLVRITR